MQPEDCSEHKLSNICENSGGDKKDEDVPRKWHQKNKKKCSTLKKLSKKFQDTDSSKDKMLAADPDFERSMTIIQGIEKVLTLCLTL